MLKILLYFLCVMAAVCHFFGTAYDLIEERNFGMYFICDLILDVCFLIVMLYSVWRC